MSKLQKYYLVSGLPENTPVPGRLPADISEKMLEYKTEKNAYRFTPPKIQPNPLIKYQSEGRETVSQRQRQEQIQSGVGGELVGGENDDDAEGAEDELDEAEMQNLEQSLEELDDSQTWRDTIETLPKHARARAKKIIPWLTRVNIADAPLADVLYDLAVPGVKKIHTKNTKLLRTIYAQLETFRDMPTNLIQRKLGSEQESSQRIRRYARSSVYTRPGYQNYPEMAAAPSARIVLEPRPNYRRWGVGGDAVGSTLPSPIARRTVGDSRQLVLFDPSSSSGGGVVGGVGDPGPSSASADITPVGQGRGGRSFVRPDTGDIGDATPVRRRRSVLSVLEKPRRPITTTTTTTTPLHTSENANSSTEGFHYFQTPTSSSTPLGSRRGISSINRKRSDVALMDDGDPTEWF